MDTTRGHASLRRSGYCERGCFHPHLHCVVPGGGLSARRTAGFPAGPVSLACPRPPRPFRRLFLEHLEKAFERGKLQFFSALESLREPEISRSIWPLCEKELGGLRQAALSAGLSTCWNISAVTPTGWPSPTAVYWPSSNGQVTFQWKDYRDDGQQKTMTLPAEEFIRRFLHHALPDGFQRIRYYGFLGNRYRKRNWRAAANCWACRPLTAPSPEGTKDYRDRYEELTGSSLRECPVCHQGRMVSDCDPAAQPPAGKRRSWTRHDTRQPNSPASNRRPTRLARPCHEVECCRRRSLRPHPPRQVKRHPPSYSKAFRRRDDPAILDRRSHRNQAASSFPARAPHRPIKTHKADILPRFSPIHF